jgi:hypothetical protein
MDVFRRAFFIDSDLAALLKEMSELVKGSKTSDLTLIFLTAQYFALSDQWTPF